MIETQVEESEDVDEAQKVIEIAKEDVTESIEENDIVEEEEIQESIDECSQDLEECIKDDDGYVGDENITTTETETTEGEQVRAARRE